MRFNAVRACASTLIESTTLGRPSSRREMRYLPIRRIRTVRLSRLVFLNSHFQVLLTIVPVACGSWICLNRDLLSDGFQRYPIASKSFHFHVNRVWGVEHAIATKITQFFQPSLVCSLSRGNVKDFKSCKKATFGCSKMVCTLLSVWGTPCCR